jgi:hypothetical protein
MIAVAIVSIDQDTNRLAGPGAAIAQWPNVFAAEANGKLNDQHEIVNGRRRWHGPAVAAESPECTPRRSPVLDWRKSAMNPRGRPPPLGTYITVPVSPCQ